MTSFESEHTFFGRWIISIRLNVECKQEPITQFHNAIFVVNLFEQDLNRNDVMKRSSIYLSISLLFSIQTQKNIVYSCADASLNREFDSEVQE